MKYIYFYGIVFIFLLSCNQPSTIGAEFLEDDQISVGFIDTLDLDVITKRTDSLLVYRIGQTVIRSFLCGNMEDPIYGSTESYIYTQMAITSREPDFIESTLDSVVLTLAFDTLGFYAIDTNKTFSIDVHRVTEDMVIDATTYSDQQYEIGDRLGGIENFKLDGINPVIIGEPQVGDLVDTTTYQPHLRIPLSTEFGNELIVLDTTTDFTTAPAFGDYFKGLRIKMSDDSEGIISFNMDASITRLSVYYKRNEDTRRYDFDLSNFNKRTIYVEHNYSGAEVESFINDPVLGDSLIFLQSLNGFNAEITINNLETLPEGIIINKAALILTQANLPEEENIFSPSDQLITFTRNTEGNLIWTNDVFPVLNDARFIDPVSGGYKIQNENSVSYELSLSTHLQRMINGEVDNKIEIGIHPSPEDASRVILNGPGNSSFPAKLEIVYTLKP